LLRAAWEHRPASAELDQEFKVVIASIVGRAFSTYRGALQLCEGGLPAQAAMLGRALFEDMVGTLWAGAPEHRAVVRKRINDKDAHRALLEQRELARLAEKSGRSPSPIDPDLARRASELDKLFRKSGGLTWFGRLWDALTEVEEYWVALGGEPGALVTEYNVVNRYLNQRLHNTVEGLLDGMQGTVNRYGLRHFSYGQRGDVDKEELLRTLMIVSRLFGTQASLAIRIVTGAEPRALRDARQLVDVAFGPLSPKALARTGRNDSCPCGSGRKAKHCHLA
jgi:hypothetical protein